MKERNTPGQKNTISGGLRIEPDDAGRLLIALRHPHQKTGAQVMSGVNFFTDEDWRNVSFLAKHHSLSPLLYFRTRQYVPWTTMPEDVRENLSREYIANHIRNSIFFDKLKAILAALTMAGVEVIPLKGIPLAELVYENRALRTIGDADLLVKVEDLAPTQAVMRTLGFAQARTPSFNATREVLQHFPPYKKAGNIDVEIHWNIGNPHLGTVVDARGLWARSRREKIAGIEVKVLSPADLLLHLCFHMSVHHVFKGHLRALFDISETLSRHEGDLDWEVFRSGCRNPAIARGSFLALSLARKYADADIPEGILEGLRPVEDIRQAMKTAEEFLFYGGYSTVHFSVARLWGSYPFSEKVRHLWNSLFLARSHMETKYSVRRSSPMIYIFYMERQPGGCSSAKRK
jgi:hypothetical protein